MSKTIFLLCSLFFMIPIRSNGMTGFPKVSEKVHTNWFPLDKATICIDASDYKVVNIATQMLADDLERIMTIRPAIALATSLKKLMGQPFIFTFAMSLMIFACLDLQH